MNKMLALSGNGSALVVFNLIDPGVYDPTTGVANETVQSSTIRCLLSRGEDTTTREQGVLKKSYEVTFTDGQLPRDLMVSDEIIIGGEVYKFSMVISDTMGVFKKIKVVQA